MNPRALTLSCAFVASCVVGCSSSNPSAGDDDTDRDAAPGALDATIADSAPADARAADSAEANDGGEGEDADAAPSIVGASIGSAYGTPLQGATGDAIPLVVVFALSDGTTRVAPDSQVTWTAPATVVARDPNQPSQDAGPNPLPNPGALPTAFYVQSAFRPSHPGVLFITDPGTASSPTITVTASIADAGTLSATVTLLPTPMGDAAAGENLYQNVLICSACHGATGAGTPQALFPDGGPELLDGGPAYILWGDPYAYPAPGLNGAPDSGNLASDPAWSFGLFAMAAQSDIDNQGVALRTPMPGWFGGADGHGQPLDAQDFADIYAFLKSQSQ